MAKRGHRRTEPSRVYLRRLLADVRGIRDRARTLFGGLTERQLHWSPDPGSWSVAQCLDHLLRANRAYLERLEPAVESLRVEASADPVLRGGRLGGWLASAAGPDPRLKIPAPGQFRPAVDGTGDDVVARFLEQQDRILALLRDARGRDLDAARVGSPVLPLIRVRVTDALQLVVGHEQRHLDQAERTMDSAGFPPG